jgi:molybdate transport system substrate-binding protein
MIRRHLVLLAALLALSAPTAGRALAQQRPLVVFAAASTKNALDAVSTAFQYKTGIKVVASYAASSALVKQIAQGAPADLYLSADLDWMDYASQHKLIQDATRVDLLGNQLVLIAPKDAPVGHLAINRTVDFNRLTDGGRIAVGDVRAVPAGKYAKAALENLGLWPTVEQKLAMAENVRVALALVARGEAPLGIVYATDARVEPKVKVIGVFPPDSHPPIIYPLALTAVAKPGAAALLAFMRSPQAKPLFERYGFTFLPGGSPPSPRS